MPRVQAGGRTTQVAPANHVRPGDHVLTDDRYVEVIRVRRAQGRKPAKGENLHLVGADEVIKVNSLDGVRIRARNSGSPKNRRLTPRLEPAGRIDYGAGDDSVIDRHLRATAPGRYGRTFGDTARSFYVLENRRVLSWT